MPDSKCIIDPERDCLGIKRAEEVDRRLTEFQQSVSETNMRFGSRIGEMEGLNRVQDERIQQIKESIETIRTETAEARREQKGSISDLRKEHKESMEELKRSNKEILDAVTPLTHKVEDLESMKKDVEEIKSKPGKTWEGIKGDALRWVLLLILGIVAVALGLDKFL